MKILITSDWYTPAVNGVVVSVTNLRDELVRRGHEVRVLTLSRTSKTYKEDDVYYIGSVGISIYPNVRATVPVMNIFHREIVQWGPDLVHSQCEFFTFSFALRIAHSCRIPLIHTYHTMYEHYTKYVIKNERVSSRLVSPIIRTRLKYVDFIIAPTAKIEENLRTHRITERIAVIPSGIDLSKFMERLTEKERSELRSFWKVPEDHKLVVFLGRLGEEKNIEEVIDNFRALRRRYDKVSLMIVGGGPHADELHAYAKRSDIDVIFTGPMPPDQVRKYYQTADVFSTASISETQGLTYIEALASGTPCVCRKDECLDGVIEDGVDGYVYETEDEFVDKTLEIFSDPQVEKRISDAARKTSVRFSKEHFGEDVEKVYEDVVEDFLPKPYNPAQMTAVRIKGAADRFVRKRIDH